jgi:UDP-glucose:(heptosyl)LPS alpha-1,3-glucosyltransferase
MSAQGLLRPGRREGHGAAALVPVTIVAFDVGPVGGMERALTELAVGLRELGHPVRIIGCRCELPAGVDIEFHRVPAPRRPFLLSYLWFLLAGSLAVRRHRRGVVHTAGAIVLGRVDSIAVHCCHQVYSAVPIAGWGPAAIYRRLLALMKRSVERHCFAINETATFVCVSDGVAEEVREHFPAAAGRVLTIHNGVDLERFSPGRARAQADALRTRLGLAPARPVAAFVAGNWGDKGLREAIEALADAPEWDLLVAGRGEREPYERIGRALGVAERVHWLGVVAEVEAVYELADAFVLPSRYETFSLVAFEAAASGLPILATPVSGVSELVCDGVDGFLLDADAGAIALRLRELGADPQLRARLGAAAREAAQGFDWNRMVERHHELYEGLAARRSEA